jgi:hypothetical protein
MPHGVGAPLKTHVAYLARESRAQARAEAPGLAHESETETPKPEIATQVDYLSRESAEGRALYDFYDGARDGVDAKALTAAWSDDVRHFRLIISPEVCQPGADGRQCAPPGSYLALAGTRLTNSPRMSCNQRRTSSKPKSVARC